MILIANFLGYSDICSFVSLLEIYILNDKYHICNNCLQSEKIHVFIL